jgi:hypothetical protein
MFKVHKGSDFKIHYWPILKVLLEQIFSEKNPRKKCKSANQQFGMKKKFAKKN